MFQKKAFLRILLQQRCTTHLRPCSSVSGGVVLHHQPFSRRRRRRLFFPHSSPCDSSFCSSFTSDGTSRRTVHFSTHTPGDDDAVVPSSPYITESGMWESALTTTTTHDDNDQYELEEKVHAMFQTIRKQQQQSHLQPNEEQLIFDFLELWDEAVRKKREQSASTTTTTTPPLPYSTKVMSTLFPKQKEHICTPPPSFTLHHIAILAQALAHDGEYSALNTFLSRLHEHRYPWNQAPPTTPQATTTKLLYTFIVQSMQDAETDVSAKTIKDFTICMRQLDVHADIQACRVLVQLWRERHKPVRILRVLDYVEGTLLLEKKRTVRKMYNSTTKQQQSNPQPVDVPCCESAIPALPAEHSEWVWYRWYRWHRYEQFNIPTVNDNDNTTFLLQEGLLNVLRNYTKEIVHESKKGERRARRRFMKTLRKRMEYLVASHGSTVDDKDEHRLLTPSQIDTAREQLLEAYACEGLYEEAQAVADSLPTTNPFHRLKLLIHAYREYSDHVLKLLLSLFQESQQLSRAERNALLRKALDTTTVAEGEWVGVSTWKPLDPFWSRQVWELYRQDDNEEEEWTDTIQTCNAFLAQAVKAKDTTMAEAVLSVLPKPRIDDFLSVLSTCNDDDQAHRILKKLQASRVLPFNFGGLWINVLSQWSKQGSVEAARVVERLVVFKAHDHAVANTVAIIAWSKCNDPVLAEEGMTRIYQRLSKSEVVSNDDGRNDTEESPIALKAMDEKFFTILIEELVRLATPSSVKQAYLILHDMEKGLAAVPPQTHHYNVVQAGLIKEGFLRRAERFVDRRVQLHLRGSLPTPQQTSTSSTTTIVGTADPDSETFLSLIKGWAVTNDEQLLAVFSDSMEKWSEAYRRYGKEEDGPDMTSWEFLAVAWERERETRAKRHYLSRIRARLKGQMVPYMKLKPSPSTRALGQGRRLEA